MTSNDEATIAKEERTAYVPSKEAGIDIAQVFASLAIADAIKESNR